MIRAVFLHAAIMGHYEEVNDELINQVIESGLADKLSYFKIIMTGPWKTFEALKLEYEARHPNIKALWRGENLKQFEYPTLADLNTFTILFPEAQVMYMCNAGVSHNPNKKDHYPGWRHLTAHYCINEHEKCFEALETHDTCGVEWQDTPVPHYSGNFWWANAEYINKLCPPRETAGMTFNGIGGVRHGAEFWIGMEQPKAATLFQTGYHWSARPIKESWL